MIVFHSEKENINSPNELFRLQFMERNNSSKTVLLSGKPLFSENEISWFQPKIIKICNHLYDNTNYESGIEDKAHR